MIGKAKKLLKDIRTLIFAVLLWLIPYLIIELGIRLAGYPGIPETVVTMYMALVWVGVILYVSVEERRLQQLRQSLRSIWPLFLLVPPLFVANIGLRGAKSAGTALFIPPKLVTNLFSTAESSVKPPAERTVVHSASPLEFVGIENPLTSEDPKELPSDNKLIKYGEVLYQNNCRWCHGKDADGKGEFAQGFLPRPANFKDTGTIAQLKQSYLLWRITEGGWEEPFFSAMPRWHEDIDDDEKWAIILYEYHHAGVSPRRAEK
ncbi:MAG: c-type cytochrome [Candidatus Binatia bacterium]